MMKRRDVLSMALALLTATATIVPVWADESHESHGVEGIESTEIPSLTLSQKIEAKLQMIAPMVGVTSVQYALLEQGELIASGDIGHTTDTLYGVGSISKMYTTLAVMQLVESGIVDLDTPLTYYIPTL